MAGIAPSYRALARRSLFSSSLAGPLAQTPRIRHRALRSCKPPSSRQASTSSESSSQSSGQSSNQTSSSTGSTRSSGAASSLKTSLYTTALLLTLSATYLYATDTRASAHHYLSVPLLRLLYPDAEDAHHAGVSLLKALYTLGLHPRERPNPSFASSSSTPTTNPLATSVFGHPLTSPLGISAGLDKNAEIPSPLFALGASVVEIGGVTPRAQPGNARPRVFRLPSQSALINRYGLNSSGAACVAHTLRARVRRYALAHGYGEGLEGEQAVLDGAAGVPPGSLEEGRLLAVQVAKNKDTKDADIEAVARDYEACVNELARYADILVVNVSSPNTPGLRSLQAVEPLTAILGRVVGASRRVGRRARPAVMVKVSPDEDGEEQVRGIVHAVVRSGVDGVIVGNTTKLRPAGPGIREGDEEGSVKATWSAKEMQTLREEGGYSGPLTFERTLGLVKRYRTALDAETARMSDVTGDDGAEAEREKVIFASGGISDGKQALAVLNAGASVAMMYTAFVYGGVGSITRVKEEMVTEMTKKK